MHSFWLGFASGVPLMIAVGPIAVLLVELGMERGLDRAWPAGLGVASADLTYATLAAICGATLQRALHPFAGAMRIGAAVVLLTLAVVMLRKAVHEIRRYRPRSGDGHADEPADHPADESTPAPTHTRGRRLAAQFMGLTLVNPLTIVAFTSLVVATGERASNLGWPLGIATASVVVHVGLVGVGSGIRRTLPPLGPSWLRVAGSVLIVGLAANLVLS